jgi:hypothetical protein
MDQDELDQLSRYVRTRVLRGGRVDLDERIAATRLNARGDLEEGVIGYLQALRRELTLGTDQAQRETMDRFIRNVRTEDGRQPDGLVLAISEEDVRIYGTDEVQLVGSPALDEIVAALDDLIENLRQDGSNGTDATSS